MRFRILGSSSAGNSALICTKECKVLLDAGFTGKRMENLLDQAGVKLEEIDAIFVTHEHSDHVTGLRGLTRRKPDIRIFANETTARVVQERLPRRLNWQIFENGLPFAFRDLEITPFSIPHDAYDPVGYRFCTGGDAHPAARRSVCWLTDLGYVTEAARRHAKECDLLVVEANHDPDMLERCQTRSWGTKQRILGRHGHLSNQAAYDLLASIEAPQWSHICLAHISAECNSLEIVEKQFAPLRNGERNLDIHIFDPASPAPGTEFDLSAQVDEAIKADTQAYAAIEADAQTAVTKAEAESAPAASAEPDTADAVATEPKQPEQRPQQDDCRQEQKTPEQPTQKSDSLQARTANVMAGSQRKQAGSVTLTQIEIGLNFS